MMVFTAPTPTQRAKRNWASKWLVDAFPKRDNNAFLGASDESTCDVKLNVGFAMVDENSITYFDSPWPNQRIVWYILGGFNG